MFDIHQSIKVSSSILAEALSMTRERILQLTEQGVFTPEYKGKQRQYDLLPSIRNYIDFVKGAGGETKKAIENADLRFKNAKGEKAELELAELKGQMHRAEDVAVIVNDMIASIRAAVLALPGRLAVDCAEARTPTEASALIKRAVDELLNEAANIKYDEKAYRKLVTEREKWISHMEEAREETKMINTAKSKRHATSSKPSGKASKPRKT